MAVASGPAGPVLAGPVAFKTAHLQGATLMGVAPRELLRCDHSGSDSPLQRITSGWCIYGAEYEAVTNQPNFGVNNQDVPCAVCHATQRSVLMIPGQYTCPTGWTREYNGYLVTTYFGYPRTTYECMDADPEAIPGGSSNQNGALFYHVEARCGSLSCPPYDNTKELTCAVCSK